MCFCWFLSIPSVFAQPAEKRPYFMTPGARLGADQYAPGKWGAVWIDIANPTDKPVELIAGMFFQEQPNLQFGRRVWLPPRAKRSTWYPVCPPHEAQAKNNALVAITFLKDVTDGKDETLLTLDGERRDSVFLPFRTDTATILLGDRETPDEVSEVLFAIRLSRNYYKGFTHVTRPMLPIEPITLDSADHIVVAADWIRNEGPTLDAIRRWTLAGGRLWIMLDQIQAETAEQLLGDAFETAVLDTIPLSITQLKDVTVDRRLSSDEQPVEYDAPVSLVRTIPSKVEVLLQQDEWPAAFLQQYGAGQVLFTTVSPRALYRIRLNEEKTSRDQRRQSSYITREPLKSIGSQFMDQHEQSIDTEELFAPYLQEHVGYAIPKRGVVLSLLFGFSGLLLGAGLWLSRSERREWMAIVTPLAALGIGGILAAMGLSSQRVVPSTLATAQLARLSPGSPDIQYEGLLASYHQRATTQTVDLADGGVFHPDRSGIESETVMLLWHDFDQAEWESLELPPGLRTSHLSHGGRLPEPVYVAARFGPEGVEGELRAKGLSGTSDLVLALPNLGALRVRLDDDGRFECTTSDTLARGEYVSGTVLSDEQRRRQRVYRRLFADSQPRLRQATLFAWADPVEMEFHFPEAERETGGLLTSTPLFFERSQPGQRVTVPAPFLRFASGRGPDGEQSTTIYHNQRNEWLETKNKAQSYFHFHVPEEVRPIRLDRARLLVEIDASERPLDIYGYKSGEQVRLEHLDGPVGRFEISIDDPELLELDENGDVLLGLFVGEHELADKDGATNWTYRSLLLEVSGTTQPQD